jgi:hypothetical protein
MKNMRDLAREICKLEGKKVQVNIAQVSEVLCCLVDIIARQPLRVVKILMTRTERYIKKYR